MVIVLGGLLLLFGLAFLMLRRRNEMLQNFLTPEEPDLEQEFFRVRSPKQEETQSEDIAEQTETQETGEAVKEKDAIRWGASDEAAESDEKHV